MISKIKLKSFQINLMLELFICLTFENRLFENMCIFVNLKFALHVNKMDLYYSWKMVLILANCIYYTMIHMFHVIDI
jgi:hypothetical protein